MIVWRFGSKPRLVLTVVCMWLQSLQFVFLAWVVGRLTTAATERSLVIFWQTVWLAVAGFAAFALVGVLTAWTRTWFVADTNIRLKSRILAGVLTTANEPSSSLLSLFTNDLKLVETNGIKAEVSLLDDILTLLTALVAAFSFDVITTLCFLAGALVPMGLSALSQGLIGKRSQAWSTANDSYTGTLKDAFTGLRTIRNYGAQGFFYRLGRSAVTDLEKALKNMDFTIGTIGQLTNFIAMVFAMTFPFGVGIYRILSGALSLGLFISILQLSNSLTGSIVDIVQMSNQMNTTKPILKRVKGYLTGETTVTSATEQANRPAGQDSSVESISLEAVRVADEEKTLLKPTSLTICQGQKILIQGPSGVGKTTLLRLIAGNLTAFEGSYRLNGRAVTPSDGGDLSKSSEAPGLVGLFAYCEQEPFVFKGNLRDNITLGQECAQEDLQQVIAAAGLADFVAENGLDFQLGEEGGNISGGQRQRIGIARALLHPDRVLLIDEGTSALNKELAHQVRTAYLSAFPTVVEVAHHIEPEDVQKFDQVLTLH